MTVGEMINALEALVEDFGDEYEDMEVVVAEYQNYGSDWAYNVNDIYEGTYSDFDKDNYDEENDEPNCVKIVLGRQIGTMKDDLW
jgi:hypothetical protein